MPFTAMKRQRRESSFCNNCKQPKPWYLSGGSKIPQERCKGAHGGTKRRPSQAGQSQNTLTGRAMLCLAQVQPSSVLQDIDQAALVKGFSLHLWSLPSPMGSSALSHSNPSLALCLAVVLTVYLVPSFLVASLAQICAPVALTPVVPSWATSCAVSGPGSAMSIQTQHPAQCDSNVPLVIGRGAPFHSMTSHSHGTIAGTCTGGGGPHRGRSSCSAPHCWRPMVLSPWHQLDNDK